MNKQAYTSLFLKMLGKDADEKTIKDYILLWWQNTRISNEHGLRLTEEGLSVIKSLDIAIYTIPFPLDMELNSQTIVYLDKFVDCPYYLTKKEIIVTHERKAVELTLFSGDLRRYGSAKAISNSRHLKDE